jgi:Peptidase propeptide and YPEB domain
MKTTSIICAALTSGLLLIGFTACVSGGAKQGGLEAQARITRTEAEKTALAKAPGGVVKEAELEKEHGRLIWSFAFATPGTKEITEVNVDALTGEVVNVEKETPGAKEDEKEEKEENEKEEKEEDEKEEDEEEEGRKRKPGKD